VFQLHQGTEAQDAVRLLREVAAYFTTHKWVKGHYHMSEADCTLGAIRRVGKVVNFVDVNASSDTNARRNRVYGIAVRALAERLRPAVVRWFMRASFCPSDVDVNDIIAKFSAEHIVVKWNDNLVLNAQEVRELLLYVADDLDIFASVTALRTSMAIAAEDPGDGKGDDDDEDEGAPPGPTVPEYVPSRVGRNPVMV
jgi:hypothetical protein